MEIFTTEPRPIATVGQPDAADFAPQLVEGMASFNQPINLAGGHGPKARDSVLKLSEHVRLRVRPRR